jgi:predicted HicB family RNase H-like nuclease
MKNLNLRLPDQLLDAAREAAQQDARSLNNWLLQAIRAAVLRAGMAEPQGAVARKLARAK